MDIPPAGGHDDRFRTAGGGDLRIPYPEHGRTVHCDQAHCGLVYGVGAETGSKDIQVVVGTGRGGYGMDGGSVCGTDGGGEGDGRGGYVDGLNGGGG